MRTFRNRRVYAKRLTSLEKCFASLERRLTSLEKCFMNLEKRFASLEKRVTG